MHRFVWVVLIVFVFLVGCGAKATGNNDDSASGLTEKDYVAADADTCPIAPSGPCELEATTRCQGNAVYQCVHVKNQQDCLIEYTLKLKETCAETCTITTEPKAGTPGTAECTELPETELPDIDTHTGPSDKIPVEIDGDPYAGMLERIPYVWHNTKPEQSSDPDGIKELWYNLKLYDDKPAVSCQPTPWDQCAENYPHEAVLRGPCEEKATIYPEIAKNNSDYVLTPYCWEITDIDEFQQFSVKNGNIQAMLFPSNSSVLHSGFYKYDIDKKHLTRMGRGEFTTPNFNGRLFTAVAVDSAKGNYAEKFPFYYDTQDKRYGSLWKMPHKLAVARNLMLSDQYAIMNVVFSAGDGDGRMHGYYTKIGEWEKWQELKFGCGLQYCLGVPQLQGGLMVTHNENLQVLFCDLAKGESSCRVVSKTGELARKPVWGKANTFYYSVEDMTNKQELFYEGVYSPATDSITVTSLFNVPGGIAAGTYQADTEGTFLLYWKRIKEDGPYYYNNPCYYRLSDKQHFCLEDGVDSGIMFSVVGFYKHYLVFQSKRKLILRDMVGYCKQYPANCPFESLTKTNMKSTTKK